MTTKEYNTAVDQYSDDLYRFALRYTNDTSESQDAVQDCFVALWEQRHQVETQRTKGWLIRRLYHQLVNRHRHLQVTLRAQQSLEPETHYSQHERFELHDALNNALATLPEVQRTLVLLRDLEGYDYAEMADITSLSQQQVAVYLYRARKQLRQTLDDYR